MTDDIEIQKGFFHPICSRDEIERVFNVQTASDHLLKLRAETIVDHMRLFRVYRNKALADEKNWSLEQSFDGSHFNAFIDHLPNAEKNKCGTITYGNMFSNDPNGSIFKTDYGPIITISDSLRFFLKFSHLALMNFGDEVPPHVRMNALRIAIRVMLKTEALDFLMDPRGIVPQKIVEAMHEPIPRQMEFIAGHELSHYLEGHLSETDVIRKPIFFAISDNDENYGSQKVYNQSQQDELAVDKQAILLPKYTQERQSELLEAALLWFGSLELYETVSDLMFPKDPYTYRTHPSARDRIENLLTNIPFPPGVHVDDLQPFLGTLDGFKKLLREDVSVHTEVYEKYGSVYLDEPNTEWRGPELIDRVDYY